MRGQSTGDKDRRWYHEDDSPQKKAKNMEQRI
jgi:hypothetical protein